MRVEHLFSTEHRKYLTRFFLLDSLLAGLLGQKGIFKKTEGGRDL